MSRLFEKTKVIVFLLMIGLVILSPEGAKAQQQAYVVLTPLQNLNFGTVVSGVAKHVSYDDPVSAGRFQLEVKGTSLLPGMLVVIIAPGYLVGPQGSRLNISYSAADGYYNSNSSLKNGVPFDPGFAFLFLSVPPKKYYFWIGGTVEAQIAQSGSYSNEILISVVYL